AGGANPFLAALVRPFLPAHARTQKLEQLVQPADSLDLFALFLGEIFFGELLEPLGRDLGGERVAHQLQPLEHVAEDAVELVEIAFVLHQRRAREIIEVLDPAAGAVLLHRLHQREIFAQGPRHAGGFELVEEGNEHGASLRAYAKGSRLVEALRRHMARASGGRATRLKLARPSVARAMHVMCSHAGAQHPQAQRRQDIDEVTRAARRRGGAKASNRCRRWGPVAAAAGGTAGMKRWITLIAPDGRRRGTDARDRGG